MFSKYHNQKCWLCSCVFIVYCCSHCLWVFCVRSLFWYACPETKKSFARGGLTLTTFFVLFCEGREDPNSTKTGHHQPASETPFKWPNNECWLGSFVIFQGIGTSIAKKPYICVIFQRGGGVWTPCHPLWIHTSVCSILWGRES